MNNPATIKRRKKLRIAKHKREAVKYHNYTRSEKFEEDMRKGFKEFVDNMNERMVDMPSDIAEIVNKNFKELLY